MIINEKSECGIISLNCFGYDVNLKRKYFTWYQYYQRIIINLLY